MKILSAGTELVHADVLADIKETKSLFLEILQRRLKMTIYITLYVLLADFRNNSL